MKDMEAMGGSIISIKLDVESTHPNNDVTYRLIVYKPVSVYKVVGFIKVDVKLL